MVMKSGLVLIYLSTAIVALGLPQTANAQIACALQAEQRESQETQVKGVNVGYKVHTANDSQIVASLCKRITDPLDLWRYGDYYPLYQGQEIKEGSKQIGQYISSRGHKNPTMQRYVCTENGANVGLYATEWQATPGSHNIGSMVLQLACANPPGQGVGLQLLNQAAADAFGKISPNNPDAGNQSVTLSITATPAAEAFYNATSLSQSQESVYQQILYFQDRAQYGQGYVLSRNTAPAPEGYSSCVNVIYDKYYDVEAYETIMNTLGVNPWIAARARCQNTNAGSQNFDVWVSGQNNDRQDLQDDDDWNKAVDQIGVK